MLINFLLQHFQSTMWCRPSRGTLWNRRSAGQTPTSPPTTWSTSTGSWSATSSPPSSTTSSFDSLDRSRSKTRSDLSNTCNVKRRSTVLQPLTSICLPLGWCASLTVCTRPSACWSISAVRTGSGTRRTWTCWWASSPRRTGRSVHPRTSCQFGPNVRLSDLS